MENSATQVAKTKHHYRFHHSLKHLSSTFGNDWFSLKAEAFARFFGTPVFLLSQTVVVACWIVVNQSGLTDFDVYPFILLNLAFSLQAAYAAPLILLAQTRQAERDKGHSEADAIHRENIAAESEQRELRILSQSSELLALLKQNSRLVEANNILAERLEQITSELQRTLHTHQSLAGSKSDMEGTE